jgi:hypothetical protein
VPTSSPLRRIGIGLLLAIAVGVLWWGGTLKADAPDASLIDAAIESLTPPGSSPGVPRQAPIIVDLAPGWTGVLTINGEEIPEDELMRNVPLNQFSFQPGPGKAIERLPAGLVVATATIWRELETREAGARSFSWTFTAS